MNLGIQSRIILRERFTAALNFAGDQVAKLTERYPDFFPVYTKNGKWKHGGERWTNRCEGFLGGIMWIFQKRLARAESDGSGADGKGSTSNLSPLFWREKAEHYSRLIEHRKTDRNVHDLGFLFWSTYKRWYDATGDEALKDVLITAGRTMGLRFREQGGYLCSFVADNSLFIDIMMNVGIVFYAATETGDGELLSKAHRHCMTTRKYLVRGDGSTAHEGIFDLRTGEFLRQSTHQGWRGDSSWARGLTWAIYGFTSAYTLTGEKGYLETAELCASFYLADTPFEGESPGVPPNDFDDPRTPLISDSSAAAIASCGLFELAAAVQDKARACLYRTAAFTILDTLSGPDFLASETPGWEGILKHGVYHMEKGLGVDESVMWGEYFFIEALDRALTLLEEV